MEDNNVENKMQTLEVEQSSDIDKLINVDIETLNSDGIIEEDGRNGFIKLPHGLALTVAETYPITASEVSKIIILIGLYDSGKTTIETTIYQLFQRRPFAGLYFAGSQSLFPRAMSQVAMLAWIFGECREGQIPRCSAALQA